MTETAAPSQRRDQWIARLGQRLEALVKSLEQQSGALALLGLGSTGIHHERLDEYSDLDFFVIVQEGTQERFLRDIEWLRGAAPITYDFENSQHGRKVLFHDGVFAEYAVFTEAELAAVAEPSMRVIWSRDPGRDWSGVRTRHVPVNGGHEQADFHLNEAITNLFVGLLRDRRGERLTAMRFIQVYAVDRVLSMQALRFGTGERRDPYVVERRAEQWAAHVPLASFCPGYAHNAEAARAILDWLVEHESPPGAMVEAVRSLLAGGHPGG